MLFDNMNFKTGSTKIRFKTINQKLNEISGGREGSILQNNVTRSEERTSAKT